MKKVVSLELMMHERVSKKYIHIFSLLDCFTEGELCTANIKEYLFVSVS